MATAKKKTAAKKSTPQKKVQAAKAKVKKALPKSAKPAPKKSVPKRSTTSSSSASRSKASTKANPIPVGREHKLAEDALKLVDQAASVLRDGIRSGAATTAKSRIAAKKKANDLLGKASSSLSRAIGDSASALQNILGKI